MEGNERALEAECPHGMGEIAWCTTCNGRDRREAKQWALERETSQRIAAVMAAKRRTEALTRAKFDAMRERTWESGREITDGMLLPGGMIDEAGPIRSARQRPHAARRIEGFVK